MKSISYMLKGTPRSLDDCMDYALHTLAPDRVVFEPVTRETLYEDYTMIVMQGRYDWYFPRRHITCVSEYGAFLADDPERCKQRKLRQANTRLAGELAVLNRKPYPVETVRSSFTYETDVRPYCGQPQGGKDV